MELTETIHKPKKKKKAKPLFRMASLQNFIKNNILANKLKDLFSYIIENGQVPESWKFSTTTLIPKEGKDKEHSWMLLQWLLKDFGKFFLPLSTLTKTVFFLKEI